MVGIEEKRIMYPRVSDIIGMQNERNMRSIPLENLLNAQIRGTKLHAYCTADVSGLLLPTIEPEYQIYMDAWTGWRSSNLSQLVASGERLYDDELCFSGEFDMLARLVGSEKTCLLDLKFTSKPSITWPVQLAAYKHLCLLNGLLVEEHYIVHIKKNTKGEIEAKSIEYPDLRPYWDLFQSALICYNYFYNKR